MWHQQIGWGLLWAENRWQFQTAQSAWQKCQCRFFFGFFKFESCQLNDNSISFKLLFQNTWSYIKWRLYIFWHPRIDYSHVLLIVMHELGCFELVCVKSLMKSQSHKTWSSMKVTGGGNIYMIKVQDIDNTRPIFMSNGAN